MFYGGAVSGDAGKESSFSPEGYYRYMGDFEWSKDGLILSFPVQKIASGP